MLGDRRPQHQPEVAADRHRRAEGLAGAEIVRPRIDAAAVYADCIGLTLHPRHQRGLGKAVAKNPACRQQPKFVHWIFLLCSPPAIIARSSPDYTFSSSRRRPRSIAGMDTGFRACERTEARGCITAVRPSRRTLWALLRMTKPLMALRNLSS